MVVKDRYVSKFIPKYQNSGIAVISVRKNVLPQRCYDTRQVRNSTPVLSCRGNLYIVVFFPFC